MRLDPTLGAAAAVAGVAALGPFATLAARRFAPPQAAPWGSTLALTAILCGVAGAVSADGLEAAAAGGLTAALVALALIDRAVLRLPDRLTLPLLLAGLAWTAIRGRGVLDGLAGAGAGYAALAALAALYRRGRGREGLGLGDAKLLAAGGAWTGWRLLPWIVLLACALAFVAIGLRVLRRGRASLREPLAFGPFLAAAVWSAFVFGAPPGLADG